MGPFVPVPSRRPPPKKIEHLGAVSGFDATWTLIGWTIFGFAVYGLVTFIRKAE